MAPPGKEGRLAFWPALANGPQFVGLGANSVPLGCGCTTIKEAVPNDPDLIATERHRD
jgi:hypothetical protein